MGIPAYFSHIIRTHPGVLKALSSMSCQFHNLYLDANSIIYDVVREIEKAGNMKPVLCDNYETICASICRKIQYYIDEIRPSNTVYIAFDGVAPLAKIKQQRNRRMRTVFLQKHNIVVKPIFSTLLISPGTEFMDFLSTFVNNHFRDRPQIIVSCSKIPGEGEHKLFEYIRENPKQHNGKNTVIYGLDADLIMLSILANKNINLFIYREAPDFMKKINIELSEESYMMSVNELCVSLKKEMDCKYQEEDRMYDYVVLCMLLGNDFLPHILSLDIRGDGMKTILSAYKETVGKMENTFLIDRNQEINWKIMKKVFERLAKDEEKRMIDMLDRNRKRAKNLVFTDGMSKEDIINMAPMIYREEEEYINPREKGWEKRKKKVLGEVVGYKKGMEWVYKYYTQGTDEEWTYGDGGKGLIREILEDWDYDNRGKQEIDFSRSLDISEKDIEGKEIKWAYCKYFWEAEMI